MPTNTLPVLPVLPAPAELFVPHRPPMLLVTTLLEANGGSGKVEAALGPQCLFYDANGEFEPAGFLEVCAQAFAALKGWEFLANNVAFDSGFLVGASHFHVHGTAHRGDTLLVEAHTVGTFEDFAVVSVSVHNDGRLTAEGRIKVYAPGTSGTTR